MRTGGVFVLLSGGWNWRGGSGTLNQTRGNTKSPDQIFSCQAGKLKEKEVSLWWRAGGRDQTGIALFLRWIYELIR